MNHETFERLAAELGLPAFVRITPEQKQSGYMKLDGAIARPWSYLIISKNDDGTYVARNPEVDAADDERTRRRSLGLPIVLYE